MIRFRALFEVPDLRPFEVDSADHYFLPGPDRSVRRPRSFWIYEVPPEVLLGGPMPGDLDLGEVATPADLVAALERARAPTGGGEKPPKRRRGA